MQSKKLYDKVVEMHLHLLLDCVFEKDFGLPSFSNRKIKPKANSKLLAVVGKHYQFMAPIKLFILLIKCIEDILCLYLITKISLHIARK